MSPFMHVHSFNTRKTDIFGDSFLMAQGVGTIAAAFYPKQVTQSVSVVTHNLSYFLWSCYLLYFLLTPLCGTNTQVILRFSDFKTDEYANLVGGQDFEPVEANPMLGWRGGGCCIVCGGGVCKCVRVCYVFVLCCVMEISPPKSPHLFQA